jgi:hypothetical protein
MPESRGTAAIDSFSTAAYGRDRPIRAIVVRRTLMQAASGGGIQVHCTPPTADVCCNRIAHSCGAAGV